MIHYDLTEFVNFTNLFELSADGYSGGAALMWKQKELESNPVTTTARRFMSTSRLGKHHTIGSYL